MESLVYFTDRPPWPGLVPADTSRKSKDLRNRLATFEEWRASADISWGQLDLIAYFNYLQDERGLSPASAKAHLSTIRAYIRARLADGTIRDALWQMYSHLGPREAGQAVHRTLRHLEGMIDQQRIQTELQKTHVQYLRLTAQQIADLLARPKPGMLVSQRDRAIMAMLFACGLRQNEVCNLQVSDLEAAWLGEPFLHVPGGYGCTERLIPCEQVTWALQWVADWLSAAGIERSYAFRGLYKADSFFGRQGVRQERLSTRTIDRMLANYPIEVNDRYTIVKPMDLRRAHARLLYEAGVDIVDIGGRLGLKDANAILEYIGGREASLEIPGDETPFEFFERRLGRIGLHPWG